jgi:ketosteroid isomerase-like protein
MCNQNEWIVREAFLAYDRGDLTRMLEFIDADLVWTHQDPGLAPNGSPLARHGRTELAEALRQQAERGLRPELEEVIAAGDRVMLVMHTPGVDKYRQRQDGDRTYDVLTLKDGLIVGLRSCRDRSEARSLAGIA